MSDLDRMVAELLKEGWSARRTNRGRIRLTHPNAAKPVFIARSGDWRARRNIQTTIKLALRDKQGAIALMTGLMLPVFLGVAALAIDVSSWSVARVEIQIQADAAAMAGAMNYSQTKNAQQAITAVTQLAQINGVTGTVNAQIVNGITDSSDVAMQATIIQTVPMYFAAMFLPSAPTVTASAIAEIKPGNTGSQPCLLTLAGDITNNGASGTIDASGCSLRSDGAASFGNYSVSADSVYAASTISGTITTSIGTFANSGSIADPFINDTTLQNAIASAATATGSAVNLSRASNAFLTPGSYTGITIRNSGVSMTPGLYLVNGNVVISGSTVIGTGVTIIASGTLSLAGNLDIEAATVSQASNGAIPGIAIASGNVAASTITALQFTGLVYYPNGSLAFSGSVIDGTSGCAESVTGAVNINGSVSLASNCSGYGLPAFGSVNASQSVSLVE